MVSKRPKVGRNNKINVQHEEAVHMAVQVGGEGLLGRNVYKCTLWKKEDRAEWPDHIL